MLKVASFVIYLINMYNLAMVEELFVGVLTGSANAAAPDFPRTCPTCRGPSGPDVAGYLMVLVGIVVAFKLAFWLLGKILVVTDRLRVNRDAKALPLLQFKAEGGDVSMQYKLGWMYEHGEGVSRNAVRAHEWYQKAADQGHHGASYRITQMNADIMRKR